PSKSIQFEKLGAFGSSPASFRKGAKRRSTSYANNVSTFRFCACRKGLSNNLTLPNAKVCGYSFSCAIVEQLKPNINNKIVLFFIFIIFLDLTNKRRPADWGYRLSNKTKLKLIYFDIIRGCRIQSDHGAGKSTGDVCRKNITRYGASQIFKISIV